MDASPEEVKRLMRLVQEWSQGEEDSFPVQLALLTRAQWRAAARIPQLLQESQALLNFKLNEFRQQVATLTKEVAVTATAQIDGLKEVVTSHEQMANQTFSSFDRHLAGVARATDRFREQIQ